jgi:hypothetical protein
MLSLSISALRAKELRFAAMMLPETVTAADLGALLGCSDRNIRDLARAGHRGRRRAQPVRSRGERAEVLRAFCVPSDMPSDPLVEGKSPRRVRSEQGAVRQSINARTRQPLLSSRRRGRSRSSLRA